MTAATLGLAAAAAGCGSERQDEDEPSRTYSVQIVSAKFPAAQAISKPETLAIEVRNVDSRRIPNIGITMKSFERRATQKGLADPRRPIWIIDQAPLGTEDNPSGGGSVAHNETWALGPLDPGQSKRFEWKLTAVDAGVHTLRYRVVAGLHGKSKAQLDNGRLPQGTFTVNITGRPLAATVDPETGRVVRSKEAIGRDRAEGRGPTSAVSGR
jgi:hypothetical protein